MKIAAIVGARPNFVKIAPIVTELRTRPEASTMLIHTGQHYDGPMSDVFFANLELPDPDVLLASAAVRVRLGEDLLGQNLSALALPAPAAVQLAEVTGGDEDPGSLVIHRERSRDDA